MQIQRFEGNPILTPRPDCWWEQKGTLNCAAAAGAGGVGARVTEPSLASGGRGGGGAGSG